MPGAETPSPALLSEFFYNRFHIQPFVDHDVATATRRELREGAYVSIVLTHPAVSAGT